MNSRSGQDGPDIPFVRDFLFAYGEPDPVAPGVQRVIANNPGPFTYTGSGSYLVGPSTQDGPKAVIDPGPDDPDHLEALVLAAGPAGISHILVSHTHRDHCGGARALAARTGALVLGAEPHPVAAPEQDAPALEEGADYQYRPDISLRDGDRISGHGWSLETVSTPGHLSNHLCFSLPGQNILFTGDHLMGWATTVILPPDGDMAAYLASLDKLLARAETLYLPTHGAPIENPHRFVRAVKTHRLMRDKQILNRLAAGECTIAEIVSTLYAGVDKKLHGAAGLNVLAHLIKLCAEGKARAEGTPAITTRFFPA